MQAQPEERRLLRGSTACRHHLPAAPRSSTQGSSGWHLLGLRFLGGKGLGSLLGIGERRGSRSPSAAGGSEDGTVGRSSQGLSPARVPQVAAFLALALEG